MWTCRGPQPFARGAKEDPVLQRALVSVFLTPPTREILEERLRKRGTDAVGVIERRLSAAREEIAQWRQFDYLLLSGAMDEDLRRMLVIIEAEKLRVARAESPEF